MVIVWLVIQVLFLCSFFSMPETPAEATPQLIKKHVINRSDCVSSQHSVHTPLLTNNHDNSHVALLSHATWNTRVWSLLKEETVVVLAILFVVMFQQTALEVAAAQL
jgi:peptidoglycan/LPS O-acetylase OafA/YrhL